MSPSFIKLKRINPKPYIALTENEFNRIVDIIPTNEFSPLRDSVMIRMLCDTGMRVSELCDLDLSQIDEFKSFAVIQTKKNGNKRTVVWSKHIHELLIKYLLIRRELHRTNSLALLAGTKDLVGVIGYHHGVYKELYKLLE